VKKLNNFLLIGAFEKNSGKTTLSERIVKKFADKGIYAVKITIYRTEDEREKYSVTEETVLRPEKDTGRLKLAGAEKVFWVRCSSFSAYDAIEELLTLLPENAPVLCESNMARKYLKPSLFLMVRKDKPGKMKETAQSVEKYADAVIVSKVIDGKITYEPDITELIQRENGKWEIAER
jgi:molybdopterin-guanine dinucleotide biosynthesis protein